MFFWNLNYGKAKMAREKIGIRNAKKSDAKKIHELLAIYAERKLLLPRTVQNIAKSIGRFSVAVSDGKLVGCCAVRDYGNNLFEMRSLAVDKNFAGRGIGTLLIKYNLEKLRDKSGLRIFALTYRPNLFIRLGFKRVSKNMFPEKIWNDCSVCAKKEYCDEDAVLLENC